MGAMGIYDQIKTAFQDIIAPELHALRGDIRLLGQRIGSLDQKMDGVDARLTTKIDAHLFPQAPEGRYRMFTRIAGLAGLGTGLALLVGFLGFIPNVNQYTVPTVYALAMVSLVGIHLRQVSARPILAWFGFAAALFGLATGVTSLVLSGVGALPPSGGEFGYLSGVALWIGSTVLGAVMLAIAVFPMPVGLAFAIGAPLGMIGLLVGNLEASSDVLQTVSLAGIVLYALGWIGAGISLLVAQPQEGVLGHAQ